MIQSYAIEFREKVPFMTGVKGEHEFYSLMGTVADGPDKRAHIDEEMREHRLRTGGDFEGKELFSRRRGRWGNCHGIE